MVALLLCARKGTFGAHGFVPVHFTVVCVKDRGRHIRTLKLSCGTVGLCLTQYYTWRLVVTQVLPYCVSMTRQLSRMLSTAARCVTRRSLCQTRRVPQFVLRLCGVVRWPLSKQFSTAPVKRDEDESQTQSGAGSSQDDLDGLNDEGRARVAQEGDRLKENIYTIPNALSFSRILLSPVIAHQVLRPHARAQPQRRHAKTVLHRTRS